MKRFPRSLVRIIYLVSSDNMTYDNFEKNVAHKSKFIVFKMIIILQVKCSEVIFKPSLAPSDF